MQPPGGAQSLKSVFFRQQEVVRRVDVMTYSFNTMSSDAAMDRGDAVGSIQIVDLPFRIPKMKQAVQWHKYRSQDAGLIWLRALIRESAKQEVPEF